MDNQDLIDSGYRWLADMGPAPGRPGLEPRWTSSQKDAVCTAYAASSRIWFTVSHGTINEVYFPTIDRPQIRDMELLFTDEQSFVYEDKRDISYSFEYIDADSLACRVQGTSPHGEFTVTKQFISDPHHPVVLMHVEITGDDVVLSKLKCYVLVAPHLDGGGAGNNARSVDVAGKRVLVAWKSGISMAVGASCGFSRSSHGFVGRNDGYQDLIRHGRMQWQYGSAIDGNLASTGEIEVSRNRSFTVALALGEGHHAAISAMMQSLCTPFQSLLKRYIEQWHRAVAPEALGSASSDGGILSRVSHSILYAHEDKRFAGAFIASASIPWGATKGDDDLGGYHLVWTRDMVQSATAMLACGRTENALRALIYLACTQRPDGGFAQNFWVDGTPYWHGIQLDEVAFPIMLAWRLWTANGLGDFDIIPFVERAVGFLVRYAPITQQERWEENAGYSPSTLAAVISGMVCAADILKEQNAGRLSDFLLTYADWLESHLEEWTTTEQGVLHQEVKRHYMRIRPPADGEPFHNPELHPGYIHIANRHKDEQADFDAREVIDGGFLELVRYGVRSAFDSVIVDSLKVLDRYLLRETPFGPCWRRYNHDGYGQQKDGKPYMGSGQGRAWPLLTGERAHYELAAGNDVKPLVQAMERFSSSGGMLPEQVWDYADMPEEGLFLGRSAGSAQPLVWAHAEYLKLLRSVRDGQVFDRIPIVAGRYADREAGSLPATTCEIFQTIRPLCSVPAGYTLRVVDSEAFEVVYSLDDWKTPRESNSQSVGYSGHFADIFIPEWLPDAGGKISLTLRWPGTGEEPSRWLGRNYDVRVTKGAIATQSASVRPSS